MHKEDSDSKGHYIHLRSVLSRRDKLWLNFFLNAISATHLIAAPAIITEMPAESFQV